MTAPDVVVVGGGVIGLSIAWRCAQRGLRVTVADPEPAPDPAPPPAAAGTSPQAAAGTPGTVAGTLAPVGAWGVAAGMLAPVTEAHFGEEPLLRLALESARRWPLFAAELTDVGAGPTDGSAGPTDGGAGPTDGGAGPIGGAGLTDGGAGLGYRTDGTLLVAYTEDDLREVQRLHRFYGSLGLPAEPLSGRECRERVPLLAPRVRGGMYAAGDHQVDPRRLVAALRRAATRAGVSFDRRRVDRLAELDAGQVVLAAGVDSARLGGLPVRGVKGQILRLRTPGAPAFDLTVRALSTARPVYLVPRTDGELVVGATSEERVDQTVTAGGVQELLRAAIDVLPEVAEYQLVEAAVGLRPGTPDNAPLLGRLDERVIAATGHYRQGVLLAPVTADLVAALVCGETPAEIAPFDPYRFGGTQLRAAGGDAAREVVSWQ
ncbi:MAG: FAD-dependent oxidoreductase [Micromonosporaceae bacterium]